MKHRILIEFTADTMPDDFLDQIAGRVYGHPAVEKKECTATLLDTADQRMTFFNNFCTSCGDADPRCQCWNDE